MKTKTQQEIEKEIEELKIIYEKFIKSRKISSDKNELFVFSSKEFNQLHKANEIGWKFEYNKLLNIAKQEAEAKQKEFCEKLINEFNNNGFEFIEPVINKLSQEVFGGKDV